MLIHEAVKEDISSALEVIELSSKAYGLPFNKETTLELLNKAIDNKWLLALVWDNTKVIGCTLAMISTYPTDSSCYICIEVLCRTHPNAAPFKRAKAVIAMIDWQEQFAKERGLKLITGHNYRDDNSPRLAHLFKTRGYKLIEAIYEKEA